MRYPIEITRVALRALAKLDKPVRRRLQSAINGLQDDPRPSGVKTLKGLNGGYRIRAGDYRMVYKIDHGRLIVIVIDLGHRREGYRDL